MTTPMRSVTRFTLILLSAIWSLPAIGEDLQKDGTEIIAGLKSVNPTTRELAKSNGLNHMSNAIRALTLKEILRENNVLSIQIDNYEGDVEASKNISNMPVFGIVNIVWNDS